MAVKISPAKGYLIASDFRYKSGHKFFNGKLLYSNDEGNQRKVI